MTASLLAYETAEQACIRVLRVGRDAGESWTDEYLDALNAWKAYDESWNADDKDLMWDAAFVLAGELGLGLHLIESDGSCQFVVRLSEEEAA